ncbi:hypothetical protein [Alloactinosynnema sp. L-07]|uniref:hypothetical protein n=1 Tax=Alloactinosynnema sp. L-07 TaxID=1653480 RepID=UPI00065EF86A|nr:hypothetical protein [Alloactinosynnema sp. L-07]CRK56487.1 hypothetical protein [Alloactinosynnema sp. L-07]
MGRSRTGLIAALGCLLALAGCGGTETPADPVAVSTTTPSPDVKPSGYQLPQGESTELFTGKTGTVTVKVGDVLVVQRTREVRQRPDRTVLVLAESRADGKLVFQAIAAGRTSLYTEDPRRAPCSSTPCPPGVGAPPSVTVEVK